MRWTGGFDPCASSTSRIIWARTVSFPTFSAFTVRTLFVFRVPPTTWLPLFFSGGVGSPVIIAITGLTDPEIEQTIRQEGADAFFEKPLDLEKVLARIEELLADRTHKAEGS